MIPLREPNPLQSVHACTRVGTGVDRLDDVHATLRHRNTDRFRRADEAAHRHGRGGGVPGSSGALAWAPPAVSRPVRTAPAWLPVAAVSWPGLAAASPAA